MADEDTFGDDEFYDRTLVKKVKVNEEIIPLNTPVESFHTLKTKLENLVEEQRKLNLKLLNLDDRADEEK